MDTHFSGIISVVLPEDSPEEAEAGLEKFSQRVLEYQKKHGPSHVQYLQSSAIAENGNAAFTRITAIFSY
jgi:hypothetical protein